MSRTLMMGSCGAAIALVAAIKLTGTSVPVSGSGSMPAARSFAPESPSYPPAMGGPDVVHPAIPTPSESRRRIVESADLYETVSKVTTQSPTIDKLAAAEALMACAYLRTKRKREPVEQAAAQELATRCAGVRQNLKRDGALDKAVALQTSAENDPSSLGRLVALSQRSGAGKAKWSAGDLALVSDALGSGDSVLATEATRALHGQLDDGSPDSKLRMQALVQAAELSARDDGELRTTFDALVNCANMGRCGDDPSDAYLEHGIAGVGVREQSEINRLVQQYRLALHRRMTALELLSVR